MSRNRCIQLPPIQRMRIPKELMDLLNEPEDAEDLRLKALSDEEFLKELDKSQEDEVADYLASNPRLVADELDSDN